MAKKVLSLVLVFGLIILIYREVWDGGYWTTQDDLGPIRVIEMEKCFRDGQIPCRWGSNLGGGYGLPLFNYYPPFFYLLTLAPRLLGLPVICSIKVVILGLLVVSFLSLRKLLNEFFSWQAAFLGAVLYLSLPFLAVELFVRGDLAELTAILLAPTVFYHSYIGIKKSNWLNFSCWVLVLAAFWLSHNIQTVIFTPLLIIWMGYWSIKCEKIKEVVLAFGLAFGLTAFFLLPAWLERDLVQIQSVISGYFDFHAHFVTLKQLFWEREWRYGISNFENVNEMSFQLGWPHWWLAVISGLLVFRRNKKIILLGTAWLLILWLMTNRSVWFWEEIPLLAYFQFPWRLLGAAGLLTVALGSWGFDKLAIRFKTGLVVIVLFWVLFFNLYYFKAERRFELSDEQIKTSYLEQNKWGGVNDYLPKTVKVLPAEKKIWDDFYLKSDYWEAKVENYQKEGNKLIIPVFAFPNWLILVNRNLFGYQINENGLIELSLGEGKYEISGWLQNTPVRLWANGISLASLFLFLMVVIKRK